MTTFHDACADPIPRIDFFGERLLVSGKVSLFRCPFCLVEGVAAPPRQPAPGLLAERYRPRRA